MFKKQTTLMLLAGLATFTLTGCLSTSFKSMGTLATPIVHQPRLDPENKNAEFSVSVDGFANLPGDYSNTEDILAGGAIVSGTYRFGNNLSPLFMGLAVAGYGGSLNFTCDDDANCSKAYKGWLATDAGKDDYSFWNIQEQFTFGAEFQAGSSVFLGISGAFRLYQGGGDYDDMRKYLEIYPDVENENDNSGIVKMMNIWLGFRMGQGGKYGSISLESSISSDFSDEEAAIIPSFITYFHPTGFHGGVGFTNCINVFLGKTFTF